MKHLSHFTSEEVSQIIKKARRAVRHPGLDILVSDLRPPEKALAETGHALSTKSNLSSEAQSKNEQKKKTNLPDTALPSGERRRGRILVVTPKKIGSSPQRNRIRRRLKAIFYEEKLFERGIDVIVFVKKKGIELTFNQLKKLLIGVFETT